MATEDLCFQLVNYLFRDAGHPYGFEFASACCHVRISGSAKAVSLGMIYKVSRVISFAQGEFFVFGGLAMATLISKGAPLPLAFALSTLIAAGMGTLLERMLIRPIQMSAIGVKITMTIGMSFTLSGAALLIWGRESYVSVPFSRAEPLTILSASLRVQVIWIVITTVAALLALWYFFERTLMGAAMRASSENPLGALLMGINVGRVTRLAWLLGSALGSVAGMMIAPFYFLQYASGTMPMIKGFTAIHADEVAAASLGIDCARHKISIFTLSSMCAALAGSLYAHSMGFISPDDFNIFTSVHILVMVFLGGAGTVFGPALGAIFLKVMPEVTRVFHDYELLINGVILISILVFMPQGLMGAFSHVKKGFRLARGAK